MPTSEQWIDDNIIATKWSAPLKASDLSHCFAQLTAKVNEADHIVSILFDVTNAGSIPAQAPMLFIRSQLTSSPNLGNMAVIGTSALAQILAQTAIKITGQNIIFFPTDEEALTYLRES